MRFIRIGDHLVNVAEASYIHFGKGAHVDIVFDDRVLSGPVSDATLFRLNMLSNEEDPEAPEKGLSDGFEDQITFGEWNRAWRMAIEKTEAERDSREAGSPEWEFMADMVDFMRSKLVD